MRNDGAPDRGGRKSGRNGGDPQRDGKSDRATPKKYCRRDRGGTESGGGPGRRLLVDAEITDDPATEGDREPGHQPACTDLNRKPSANAMRGLSHPST